MADQNALEVEIANLQDDSTFRNTIINAFALLDTSIADGSNNLKDLSSRFDQVVSLKREVELKEKAAEEAKEVAATSGLDILAEVEELKQEQQSIKETNDMVHARKVYEQRAVLAKDLEQLQLRVSGVSNEGRTSVGDFDLMHRLLKMRLTEAEREKELADKEKLQNEILAREALVFKQSQILKLLEEANKLEEEEVKNSKLQDLFKRRESTVNILQGDVSAKHQDINVLKSTILPSSSSSVAPGHGLQLKTDESNETPKKTTDEPVQVAGEFVLPENGLLLKSPNWDSEIDWASVMEEGNMNVSNSSTAACRAMSDQNAFEVETENHDADSTFCDTITGSFERLDSFIDDATSNKKSLASALDLVKSLVKEVELKEKAAEEAKVEAATSGLDILAKVEELKQEQQRDVREMLQQKADLAKKLKKLELSVFDVLNEGNKCLGHFDEMRIELDLRLTSAIREKELADEEKLEKRDISSGSTCF
ncbi:hypothetical protein SSX86_026872 [Deinandra increscens subsp. villosa]|uniref:Uncharacterized protein n=1 Tax=Deinandra increscens subsp. villosa TaxID=3103831 RepID=A0AAP0CKF7_9ASTR